MEQNMKLEKHWPHIFTSTIALTQADMWYKKLRETIEKQQQQSIWLPDSKPSESISDDFLFPTFLNTSRLSYASSPESDIEMDRTLDEDTKPSAESFDAPRLVKASSDPSLAIAEEPTSLYAARTHRQLPLHMLLRKELSKALRRSDSNLKRLLLMLLKNRRTKMIRMTTRIILAPHHRKMLDRFTLLVTARKWHNWKRKTIMRTLDKT